MTELIQNILQISISTAAVIGVMLLLVPVWQKRYSAKWRKVIWLIIAVRLLIPFSIELPSAPVQMNVDLHETVAMTSQQIQSEPVHPAAILPESAETTNDVTVSTVVDTSTQEVNHTMTLNKGTVLFLVWLVGLLLFTIYHAVQYRRFYGKIMASARPVEDSDELLERAGKDLALGRYPAVLFSGNVQSPMLIGYRKPTVLLPYRLYGENELVMILRHELTHYKHHDLWYKLILLCANGVHWFNPLVWLMNRQAGRDLEQVCDDCVVNGQDMEYRKAYSMTILNTMANQKGVALSTHLSKDAQNTKKRFSAILQPKQYKKGIAVLLAVLVLAVGISGCLQITKPAAGWEYLKQIEDYLPEQICFHESMSYETYELANQMISHSWIDWEDESAVKSNNEKRNAANRCWIDMTTDENDTIISYSINIELGYRAKENLPVKNMTDEDAKKLAEGILYDLSGETALHLKEWEGSFSGHLRNSLPDGYIGWLTDSNEADYHYEIVVNKEYGYVSSYQKIYYLNLLEQVESWLAVEETRLYGETYDINWYEVAAVNEACEDNVYSVDLYFTMIYRNVGDRDTNTHLNQLKELGSTDYQYMYDNYYVQQQASAILKIEAEILPDGTLDMENCNGASGNTYWDEIPGLYEFYRDSEADGPGWNKDKTQVLWVADNYLHAFIQQDLAAMQKFSTVEPMESDSKYLVNARYDHLQPQAQEYREQLVSQFKKYYGSTAVVNENTVVHLELTLKVQDHYFGEDYLNLTLQKVKGYWKVTDVSVEQFRV